MRTVATKKSSGDARTVESAAVAALRIGDVKKALQVLSAAPFAPTGDRTVEALKALHPQGKDPRTVPRTGKSPVFIGETVKDALASFGTGSAAGLFGYRPFLLQQCVRAESFTFLSSLTSVIGKRRSPGFSQGVSGWWSFFGLGETQRRSETAMLWRPDSETCGQVFLGGKDEITRAFKNKNFGVGCLYEMLWVEHERTWDC
jgi:hypothetical protein